VGTLDWSVVFVSLKIKMQQQQRSVVSAMPAEMQFTSGISKLANIILQLYNIREMI